MTELIFVVEEALDGGYTAKALGEPIFTQAEDIEELHRNVREAVTCHFEADKRPAMLRLHFVKEELLPV
jgi:predicted RNase H-like HicB family nuclease